MTKILAVLVLLMPLAAFATGETQSVTGVPINGGGSGAITGSTACGSTALLFNTPGAGTFQVLAAGTISAGSIRLQTSLDGTTFTSDLSVWPRQGGAATTGVTSAGTWLLTVRADSFVCIYGSGFTGSATVKVFWTPTGGGIRTNFEGVGQVQASAVSALETIACNSGVSPCTIGTSAVTVLNANPQRYSCALQNVGLTDPDCLKSSGTPSAANMHFVLGAASHANGGDGGVWHCTDPGSAIGVSVSCVSSAAGGILNASAN